MTYYLEKKIENSNILLKGASSNKISAEFQAATF